jgi:hypothetical protein
MVSTPARLPVTQEAAGSSPVAPAKSSSTRNLMSKRQGLDYSRYADLPLLIAGGGLFKQGCLIEAHDTLRGRCRASSCVRSALFV